MRTPFTIESIKNSPVGPINQHLVKIEKKKKRNKFGANKRVVDGIEFDSTKEAKEYGQLKMRLKAGEIGLLELQVPFLLIEKNETERACYYVADFVYRDMKTGEKVVVDVKSDITRKQLLYVMKRKLMLEKYGIKILEK